MWDPLYTSINCKITAWIVSKSLCQIFPVFSNCYEIWNMGDFSPKHSQKQYKTKTSLSFVTNTFILSETFFWLYIFSCLLSWLNFKDIQMQEFTLLSNQMRLISTFSKTPPYSSLYRLVGTCWFHTHKDMHLQGGFNICASKKHLNTFTDATSGQKQNQHYHHENVKNI